MLKCDIIKARRGSEELQVRPCVYQSVFSHSWRIPPIVFNGRYQRMSNWREWALCTASLLPEFQPAPCFLSVIIGHID